MARYEQLSVGELTADVVNATTSTTTTESFTTLTATTGTVTTLNSTTGTIAALSSTTGTVSTLSSTNATIATLDVDYVMLGGSTAVNAQNLLQGVTTGKGVTSGIILSVTATKNSVDSGLTSLDRVMVSDKNTGSAPSAVYTLASVSSGGGFNVTRWKTKEASPDVLIAATTAASVEWIAFGTV